MEALSERSISVRSRRAQIKREIATGAVDVEDLMLNPPPSMATCSLYDMLIWIRGLGRVKVIHLCQRCRVDSATHLRDLNPAQVKCLLARVRDTEQNGPRSWASVPSTH